MNNWLANSIGKWWVTRKKGLVWIKTKEKRGKKMMERTLVEIMSSMLLFFFSFSFSYYYIWIDIKKRNVVAIKVTPPKKKKIYSQGRSILFFLIETYSHIGFNWSEREKKSKNF